MRFGIGTCLITSGSKAVEFYIFNADPRNSEGMVVKEHTQLDNNTFT